MEDKSGTLLELIIVVGFRVLCGWFQGFIAFGFRVVEQNKWKVNGAHRCGWFQGFRVFGFIVVE